MKSKFSSLDVDVPVIICFKFILSYLFMTKSTNRICIFCALISVSSILAFAPAYPEMRYRDKNSLLKITFAFIVCVLFYSLWHISNNSKKSYLNEPINSQQLSRLYERLRSPRLQIRQNGEFWILENYIIGSKRFDYLESITYTTHADYTFLDNLEVLVKRWRAPISVAIFSPGLDFYKTMYSIEYIRSCSSEHNFIRELVTFHIYFPAAHMPSFIPKTEIEFNQFSSDCSSLPAHKTKVSESYRRNHSIFYPINVGRNIARRLARTHFIFPSDIEMYPSLNFVEDFLSLINRRPELLFAERQVYPLAVFEVEDDQEIPNTKSVLKDMVNTGKAIPFHKDICMGCHAIANLSQWLSRRGTDFLDIFLVTKHRPGWEPFYVTTNLEPFYDERYTWEGRYDKQIQADILGIMDYDFYILDNAFLIHRPGIKVTSQSKTPESEKMFARTILEIIPQLKALYGNSSPKVNLSIF